MKWLENGGENLCLGETSGTWLLDTEVGGRGWMVEGESGCSWSFFSGFVGDGLTMICF